MYGLFHTHRPSQQAKAFDQRCIRLYCVCISEIILGSRDLQGRKERGTKAKLRAKPKACINASLKMVLEVFRLHILCDLASIRTKLCMSPIYEVIRWASFSISTSPVLKHSCNSAGRLSKTCQLKAVQGVASHLARARLVLPPRGRDLQGRSAPPLSCCTWPPGRSSA